MVMMNFDVSKNGLTMRCRVFMRTGGFRSGRVCLSGYVGNEQRMECDVTVTYRAYRSNPTRLKAEMEKSALGRLTQILSEGAR